jgi:hypothetical protein
MTAQGSAPTSLLATTSWEVMDRDGYIWCYSPKAVNVSMKTMSAIPKKLF